jgi:hypothetical protein
MGYAEIEGEAGATLSCWAMDDGRVCVALRKDGPPVLNEAIIMTPQKGAVFAMFLEHCCDQPPRSALSHALQSGIRPTTTERRSVTVDLPPSGEEVDPARDTGAVPEKASPSDDADSAKRS